MQPFSLVFLRAFALKLLFALCLSVTAHASLLDSLTGGFSEEAEFLPVEEAFQVSGTINDRQVTIKFTVTPGHYLYRHMMGFEAVNPSLTRLGSPLYPKGITKYDKFLKKELETYPEDLEVILPVETDEEFPEVRVKFQGCADAGLCYPPTSQIIIPISNSSVGSALPSSTSLNEQIPEPAGEQSEFLASLLNNQSLFRTLVLFFLGGLALTFTPCVLPMIPIISSMVAGSRGSKGHAITLTCCYVLAMSVTYALAGMLMGYFGASLNLQARLQSPWLLIPFSVLFVVLALSMFGLYELQLPEKLRDKLSQADQKTTEKHRGTKGGAVLMGIFSTLLVSPCVSAPLAGALVFISSTENVLMGGLALFCLGLGMGTPLFIIGAGGATLLPKAGAWMDSIKATFGVMMLGVAIWLIERLIPAPVTLLLWGTLAIGSAVFMGALDFSRRRSWKALQQVTGILLLVYGITLIVGGIKGNDDPLRPLASLNHPAPQKVTSSHSGFIAITTSSELESYLDRARQQSSPVVLDFYADWCISCKIFERQVLPKPEVVEALKDFTTLKLDLTENSADQRAILSKYNLFGPPAFIFFNKSGEELKNLRAQGEIDEKIFKLLLKKAGES